MDTLMKHDRTGSSIKQNGDEKSLDERVRELEELVEMYERVFSLSRNELKQAYNTIEAHEAVEDLSRSELRSAFEEMESLQHKSSVKSNFFSNISHEIRTPLTLMVAPLESMLQGELGDFNQEQKSYLQLMQDNSQRLLKMVNELLDFSKIESGKMKLYYKEVDFNSLLKSVLEPFIPLAEKQGLELNIELAEKPVTVYCDVEKIEKVIVNIVFNALKYVSEQGRIDITLFDSEGTVGLRVFNSGKPLPKDVLSRVFDRYAQFEVFSQEGANFAGSGLGLALARELITLHQGEIAMKNQKGLTGGQRNKGVICEFSLPKGVDHIDKDLLALGWGELERRKDGEGKVTRELPTVGVSSLYNEIEGFYSLSGTDLQSFENSVKDGKDQHLYSTEKRKSVLIVEDNNEMRGFLRYVLKNYFDITVASNGEEGYRKAKAVFPDLIISDIMMPVMNGYEMTRRLRENENTQRIPIILLTARAKNVNAMIDGLNIGANDYISKPFNIKELIARSNALLRMADLHDQLESTEGVIFSLANAVEAKDAYTEGHCFRLAEISSEIARRLNFSEYDLQRINNGAILHDVGKIGVPEAVLTKPGLLTEEERQAVEKHPLIGEKICKPLKSTSNILPIIRSHHERWDGKGYPDGLGGEEIPLEARIVAIADAFDAMVFDRVYRQGMGLEQARSIFEEERDFGQWDPALVDVFLAIDTEWLRGNLV